MKKWLAAWWNSLSHPAQAGIMAFAGAAFGVLWNAIDNWAHGQTICTVAAKACALGYLSAAIKSGVVAVAGLYTKSSLYSR